MRCLAFALFIIAAISYCQALTADELINRANQVGAPFPSTAINKFHGGPWVAKRAKGSSMESEIWEVQHALRSTAVVIINFSRASFKLKKAFCVVGSFTKKSLPAHRLPPRTSTVFGIQSTGNETGVQCTIMYGGRDRGSWISMMIDSPLDGDNIAYTASSRNLEISPDLHHGDNNLVRFMVIDSHPHASPGQNGGLGIPSRTPKQGQQERRSCSHCVNS